MHAARRWRERHSLRGVGVGCKLGLLRGPKSKSPLPPFAKGGSSKHHRGWVLVLVPVPVRAPVLVLVSVSVSVSLPLLVSVLAHANRRPLWKRGRAPGDG